MIAIFFSAFWTYTLITALTPGPNNILALSTSTRHGLRQSSRVLAGMSLGFLIIMLICAGIAFSLVSLDPRFTHILSWVGAIYMLWLALKIATSQPAGTEADVQPIGFWASFGLQFFNVKIILYGITALSTFVLPYTTEISDIVGMSVVLAAIGSLGNLCWALAGQVFQKVFQRFGRTLNILLALMLVYCAVRIFY
ncbi:cysteine/O-acetylserine transporter [Cedecea sp. NFIX57]|uniref:cysteine/O-acetylserine transporter n=1 Tax=Cedecea sp. NFIX57 TaxID=1566286 RepID=UPI000A0BD9BC|nr:cysteine/O-acetylserine transporter [Cedecea sp. NFIX57]SMG51504.1 cysteine/O-acetylserine efflux protein [Cedecea sp. NFIX57]